MRCRAFKEELTASAKTLENRLLDQVRARVLARHSNHVTHAATSRLHALHIWSPQAPPTCTVQLRALNRTINIKINEEYSVMMTEVGKVRKCPW